MLKSANSYKTVSTEEVYGNILQINQRIAELEAEKTVFLEKAARPPIMLKRLDPYLLGKQNSDLTTEITNLENILKLSDNRLIYTPSRLKLLLLEMLGSVIVLYSAFRLIGSHSFAESVPPFLNVLFTDIPPFVNAMAMDVCLIVFASTLLFYMIGNNYEVDTTRRVWPIVIASGSIAIAMLVLRICY
ncbi:MAG: hypothetical protein HQK96_16320 [Nitrospirae bacterium]|nr:hypothetical protein [Nitrospirota bacterium]